MVDTDGIVGEWKEFVFKLIEPSDYENITEHLRENFYKDEPLCQLMGYSEETSTSFNRAVCENLTHNLSFCAVHKESQKIAGVRVMYESSQDEYSSSPAFQSLKSRSALWTADNIVHQFLTELEDKCNIFQMYGTSRCAQFKLTSVAREFRSQGLATEMYGRSINFLRGKGFTMAKGSFSNDQTRHIANKFGFKELARLYIKDFRSQDGVPLFPNSADQYVALMALKF